MVPLGIFEIAGILSLFFVYFGMWRFWIRLDQSPKWLKRLWFLVLLIGFWWGSVLYFTSAIYLKLSSPEIGTEREAQDKCNCTLENAELGCS